ncbi:hypothetical protein [Rhizobium leguminosarum]|uniref:hypothetical protein n=1 Tax=Rhizobium leguminosarum TaxID=384 RepID=UPI003F9BC7F4
MDAITISNRDVISIVGCPVAGVKANTPVHLSVKISLRLKNTTADVVDVIVSLRFKPSAVAPGLDPVDFDPIAVAANSTTDWHIFEHSVEHSYTSVGAEIAEAECIVQWPQGGSTKRDARVTACHFSVR